jgi:hypothetical protein
MPIAVGDHQRAVEIGKMGGRPIGSKDREYLMIKTWYDKIDWDELPLELKATLAMKAICVLLAKKVGPDTPEESVENVERTLAFLKTLTDAKRIPANA